jgi:hypothetical protein
LIVKLSSLSQVWAIAVIRVRLFIVDPVRTLLDVNFAEGVQGAEGKHLAATHARFASSAPASNGLKAKHS